jgi:hypothetical protein
MSSVVSRAVADRVERISSVRVRVAAACERWGHDAVVRRCAVLLAGGGVGEVDTELVLVLGGEPARRLVAGGVPDHQRYWLRVWAARGLLWAGPPLPLDSLRASLQDEAWRVREMACKVVARHLVDDLFDDVVTLEADTVDRVRIAARRAAMCLAERT